MLRRVLLGVVGLSACAALQGQITSASATRGSTAGEPRVSARGSDVSDLPTVYPQAAWLAIDAPLLDMSLTVKVQIGGAGAFDPATALSARATLDTGASNTTLSYPMAEQLGLIGDGLVPKRPVRGLDAHGNPLLGERVTLRHVAVGRHHWQDVDALVLGDQPELFLIGADLLQDVDLYIAADEGLVGLFDAGTAPTSNTDRVVTLLGGERQLLAVAETAGSRGAVPFRLVVDTGAWNTSVPLIAGINGGIAADTTFEAITLAVGGEQENRGRFVLQPLRLGPERTDVGRVMAIGSALDSKMSGALGLLGNDVMMRTHSIVSFRRAQLRLLPPASRPALRTRGPSGVPCQTAAGVTIPCVSVALVDSPEEHYDATDLANTCLQIHVDKAFANSTLELAITGAQGDLFNGGAIRAFVTVDDKGVSWCAHLWKQLGHLGVRAGTPLSLRWVRGEGVVWPCDPMKTKCITFTGPLAKDATKNAP